MKKIKIVSISMIFSAGLYFVLLLLVSNGNYDIAEDYIVDVVSEINRDQIRLSIDIDLLESSQRSLDHKYGRNFITRPQLSFYNFEGGYNIMYCLFPIGPCRVFYSDEGVIEFK